jgi:hypothetical protein
MTMNVIPPLAGLSAITPAMLTSTTAPEPGTGETVWSSTANYPLNQVVIRTTTHRQYINLVAGADTGLPENTPLRWKDIGPTNRWAMFDLTRNAQTVLASPLTVVITPGQRVDSLALIGMAGATSATITVTSGGTTVYSVTRDLNKRLVANWYQYRYAPFGTKAALALFDLPPYLNAVVTITLTSASGSISCGACVLGMKQYIGQVQYSAESDMANYSDVTRDADGNADFNPVPSIPLTTSTTYLDKAYVDQVYDLRTQLNGTPAVYAGLDDDTDGYFGSLLILGFYRKFVINIADPTRAEISLQLEEI